MRKASVIHKLIALTVAILSLFSCNNDLDIYAEEQVLPYVYGYIVSNETDHYIKVTKTFQKSAKDVITEDLYYHNDSIQVFVDVYKGGDVIESHEALVVEADDKAEGIFPFPTHKYYKVSDVQFINDESLQYATRVEFSNGKTCGNLKPFQLLTSFNVFNPQLNFTGAIAEIKFEDGIGRTGPYVFNWWHKGGAREEVVFKISLLEINEKKNTTDTVTVPIRVYNDIPNDDEVKALLFLPEVYRRLSENLEKNPDIKRRMLRTEIYNKGAGKEVRAFGLGLDLWSESKDLSSYETIMFTQTGIYQDKPNFTNLENALGLYSTKVTKQITAESEKLFFGERTLDSLACSPSFFEYNFARSYIDNLGLLQIDDSPQRCNDL